MVRWPIVQKELMFDREGIVIFIHIDNIHIRFI